MYPVELMNSLTVTHLIWDNSFVYCLCLLTRFDRKRLVLILMSVGALLLQSFLFSDGLTQLSWVLICIFQT